jgi:hypothetical protein
MEGEQGDGARVILAETRKQSASTDRRAGGPKTESVGRSRSKGEMSDVQLIWIQDLRLLA